MCRRKGVVDVEIAERREAAGESRIVLLLAGVEAQILEERNLARRQRRHDAFGRRADAILGKGDGPPADRPAERRHQRPQGEFRRGLALGTAEMRHDDDASAPPRELGDGGRQPLDPRRVRHSPVLHRHVEIGAQQHALAVDIEIVEGAEAGHRSSLIGAGGG